jgi:hypothetical protein
MFGFYIFNVHSYDYAKFLNDDNDTDILNKIFSENISDKHRVRRAVVDNTTTIDYGFRDITCKNVLIN